MRPISMRMPVLIYGLGAGVLLPVQLAAASINIEMRPSSQTVLVGSTVNIGIYIVSDSASPQSMSVTQVILNWQPSFLSMLSNNNAGAVPLLFSGFHSPEGYGLNESLLPSDGNAMYEAWAPFSPPGGVMATAAGTLLTTLRFTALAVTPSTPVSIPVSGGAPLGRSEVFDGVQPNTPVTGSLSGASVTIIPTPAAGAVLGLLAIAGSRRRRL